MSDPKNNNDNFGNQSENITNEINNQPEDNNLDCDELYKMFIHCRNSDGDNAEKCKEVLNQFKYCSDKSPVKSKNDENSVDETIFN
jgi:hypothetical protein